MIRALPLLVALLSVACAQKPAAPAPIAAASPGKLPGRVLESISASSYSYLRLQTATGEVWAAVPSTEVAVGTDVTLVNAHEMKDFQSKTLNRKFDSVLFGTLAGEEGAAVAKPAAAPIANTAGNVADAVERTIAAVYAERAALESKAVTVRGEVVKFTPGILDRNWVHLRDGTGGEVDKDNDLTVTTTDQATVGETVTATGILRLEKDFGAGYQYPVIVEEARLSR